MSSPVATAYGARPNRRASSLLARLRRGDEATYIVTLTCALSIIAITVLLFYELYLRSLLSRQKFGWAFLFSSTWDPVAGQFGSLPFIYRTSVTSAFALLS